MTTARIDARFAKLKAEGRAGFVPYVMTGDPSRDEALEILKGLPAAGADLIELGLAFSDPMAEGPPIQRAALRGLKAGMTLRGTLDLVADFRKGDQDTPLILMGYLNPVESYGYEVFARDAAGAGVDGIIVVDCPPEEAAPLLAALKAADLSLIRLATPTSDDERLKVIAEGTSGFVYYVSVAGVTGVKEAVAADVAPAVERVRRAANLPVAVGFGVKTPERAAEIARVADAVVAGSVFVDEVAAALEANEPAVPRVLAKVKALADAVKTARTSASVTETV
ncbi:tryptophan synthase subunit alpha [Brevundimonas diminuta]|uniref:Tryptophan synthase alpha chain n=1 Tax=Brevundimonas diminuta TaxID=293 RepID=A0A410NTV4_BREDI|nr:tryptophan synthase subunit alpha [Brevundimonas diminuta]MBD3571772.1 tryptophan synthase subunit alpha [Brevundimonas diminuta]QAT13413.1 tryptophan synthase subunit alpha [Brevundimonas diminuta]QQB89220.1 tryptophan synthase subunit alpha [Brevundimonas diminuta]GEB98995.1 tryptophan synthase alpha chain [Brevundimonas diminuta]